MSNNYWRNIYNSYRKIFDVYTESEDQKYQFTKETILKVINTVDVLYSKGRLERYGLRIILTS